MLQTAYSTAFYKLVRAFFNAKNTKFIAKNAEWLLADFAFIIVSGAGGV